VVHDLITGHDERERPYLRAEALGYDWKQTRWRWW